MKRTMLSKTLYISVSVLYCVVKSRSKVIETLLFIPVLIKLFIQPLLLMIESRKNKLLLEYCYPFYFFLSRCRLLLKLLKKIEMKQWSKHPWNNLIKLSELLIFLTFFIICSSLLSLLIKLLINYQMMTTGWHNKHHLFLW